MATWRAGRTASHGDRGAGRPLRPAPVPARPAAPTTRRRAALSHTGHVATDMSGFDGEVCVRYEAVYRRAEPACGERRLLLAVLGAFWLVAPAGWVPQFRGADSPDDDGLYAKPAEDFVRDEVLPRLEEIEAKEAGLMPALLKRAGELGLLMVDIPEKYGGLGLPQATSMLVSPHRALCASFSVSWGAHTGTRTPPLVDYWTQAQKP